MRSYVYAYRYDERGEEVLLRFPKFPQIVSPFSKDEFTGMSGTDIESQAADMLITALQTCIAGREEIPLSDDQRRVRADGFVTLSALQAMKLELFAVYKENCRSVSDFSKQIDKQETVARRMLNLRHPSVATEIEAAIGAFGKRLVHSWDTEPINAGSHSTRSGLAAAGQRSKRAGLAREAASMPA